MNAAERNHESNAGHEYTDVSARTTVFSILTVAGLIVGCCLVGRWMFDQLLQPADMRSNTSANGDGLVLPPQPRLEGIEMMSAGEQSTTPLLSAQQTELEQLQTYGWVNKNQRIVRIPIRQAMKLVIEHGLPGSNSNDSANPRINTPRNAVDENR
jgi:hypothetical protein